MCVICVGSRGREGEEERVPGIVSKQAGEGRVGWLGECACACACACACLCLCLCLCLYSHALLIMYVYIDMLRRMCVHRLSFATVIGLF